MLINFPWEYLRRYRIVNIQGERGAGKDMLALELAVFYLRRGYRYWTNQLCIWNDPIYRDDGSPDVKHRIVTLSEAGRYIREYRYFQDIFEFARKFDQYLLLPSVRPPHEDLQAFTVSPTFFRPVWQYVLFDGVSAYKTGRFIFIPSRRYMGVYDTLDVSLRPDPLLRAIERQIEIEAAARGRDKLSVMAEDTDPVTAASGAEQGRLRAVAISLSRTRSR
jgi:hypothetical protein